jgi:hypothetical protein
MRIADRQKFLWKTTRRKSSGGINESESPYRGIPMKEESVQPQSSGERSIKLSLVPNKVTSTYSPL